MSGDAPPPGKELVSGAEMPSDPRHTCDEGGAPTSAGQAAGCPGQRALSQEGPGGASWGSVLLLLLSRCDCGELVLDPEALHKEAQDGAVQVLLEGGAAEVVTLVRVDLKGAENSATRPPPWRPGARETRRPPTARAARLVAPTAQGILRVSGKESDDTLFSRLGASGSACSDPLHGSRLRDHRGRGWACRGQDSQRTGGNRVSATPVSAGSSRFTKHRGFPGPQCPEVSNGDEHHHQI